MADRVNATLKVYYLFNGTKCLARGGPVAAIPIAPGASVATIDLRSCALAVCSSSPELIADKNIDYSIYTLDATEGPDGDLYEGQGLLCWALSQPPRLAKVVSGFIRPSLSGNVLEIRMKLSQVGSFSQQECITSMQSFERIFRTLPATFDYSNWTEFMKHATPGSQPQIGQAMHATVHKPPIRNVNNNQTNTLHRTRELAARQQTPRGMVAQFKTTKQQQTSQQRHARNIAQQAAATAKSQTTNFASVSQTQLDIQPERSISQEGDGPLPESPHEPPASSPPQMKTFAPPPPASGLTVRSNSLPSNPAPGFEYTMPMLSKFTSTGNESPAGVHARGTKRKAAELNSAANHPPRTKDFSPSKAVNAAKNSIGAVQQLFKVNTPGSSSGNSPAPSVLERMQKASESIQLTLPPATVQARKTEPIKSPFVTVPNPQPALHRTDSSACDGPKDGQVAKSCHNCGNNHTKGNWRQVILTTGTHNLCNACGVYWKTRNTMRPAKLWAKLKQDPIKNGFPAHSGNIKKNIVLRQATPSSSDVGQYDPSVVVQTSPAKGNDHQNFQQSVRATRSSPVQNTQSRLGNATRDTARARPTTPTRGKLQELQVNTPQPQPSPSPAGGDALQELVALLQTPKKTFSSKAFSSPSPWKTMFTLLEDVQKDGPASPSRKKLDKMLEDRGTSASALEIDFDLLANYQWSPNDHDYLASLEGLMSSPPGLGVFTSSAGQEGDNSTPEDVDLPASMQQIQQLQELMTPDAGHGLETGQTFEEGDSLFTPNTPKTPKTPKKHNTRSQPGSVQRNLRSAGTTFEENLFGGELPK